MKYCVNCLFPDTKPELSIDENGICDACRTGKYKNEIDWVSKRKELKKIFEESKSTNGKYDCIIPVSGGMGAFYGPNNSATLSVTNSQNYGAVISFINLVRNGGNLLSIPLSTLIVTSVMGSLGQEPDLTVVTYSTDSAVFSAFLSGMQSTFRILCTLTIIAMILSIYKSDGKQHLTQEMSSNTTK